MSYLPSTSHQIYKRTQGDDLAFSKGFSLQRESKSQPFIIRGFWECCRWKIHNQSCLLQILLSRTLQMLLG